QLLLTWGVLVGLGTGTTAMVLGATVVSRWFSSRRGAVMGVLTASTATGQMLFLPLEAHVVEQHGWRAVTLLVALVVALLLPLVGLLAVMGVFDLVGTTASGWLSDRFDSRKLLSWYYGLRGLALLWLPQAFDAQVLGPPVFAVFYGLDWIATVPPTVRLTTEAVGVRDAPIA